MKKFVKKNIVIIKNFFSLSLLNLINFATPLITLPYLLEILGIQGYGKYAFAYTILMYIIMIVNYGFQFSATHEVSIHRKSLKRLSKIFTEALIIRLGIGTLLIFVSFVSLASIPKFHESALLIMWGSGIIVGTILMPNYLFQGLEKMAFVTIVSSIPKLVMLVSIFFVIKKPEDIKLLMLIQSIGFVMAGLISTYIAKRNFNVALVKTSIKDIINRLSTGFNLFISTIGISLYRESSVIILGVFTSYEVVGFYSAAEKIIKAIQALLNPLAQSLFPHFALALNSSTSFHDFKKIIKYYTIVLLFITINIILTLPYIIQFFFDDKYNSSILDMRLLSPVVFFGSLNFVIGIVGLVNLGKQKYFTKTVIIIGLLGIVGSTIAVQFTGDVGVAIMVSLTEIAISIFLYKKLRSLI